MSKWIEFKSILCDKSAVARVSIPVEEIQCVTKTGDDSCRVGLKVTDTYYNVAESYDDVMGKIKEAQ